MELHTLLHEAKEKKKKILVVVGDGIEPFSDLHGLKITKINDVTHQYRDRLKSHDSTNWPYFEFARFATMNEVPTYSYYVIFLLARLGLLDSIVTTNYDMTFDSMFSRLKKILRMPVYINPILHFGEVDPSNYTSCALAKRCIRLWKIHGSLSHVMCRKCHTLLLCPDFVLPFNDELSIQSAFTLPLSHNYNHETAQSCGDLASKKPDDITESLCGHYVYPLDWNFPDFNNIEIFKRIINSGLQEFEKNPFAILFIGFKGYYPQTDGWYEEINVAAEKLDGKPIYWAMYVSNDQYDKINPLTHKKETPSHAHLWNLVKKNKGIQESGTVYDIGDKLKTALIKSGIITERKFWDIYIRDFSPFFLSRGFCEREKG